MKEFARKYRPKTLDEVIGQRSAIRIIKRWVEGDCVPHAIMFYGPSGCGKTTMARILQRELGCHKDDFEELNCADTRGIDTIREIRRSMSLHAIHKCRICLLDEAHKLSNDAQNALLKMLEDPPDTFYFILCTTDPAKLIRTIQTRCSTVAVSPIGFDEMLALIMRTVNATKGELSKRVAEGIIDAAEGSARKALNILEQVLGIRTEGEQLEAISKFDHKNEAVTIAKALMDPRTRWPDMTRVLKSCDLEEPERLRHLILAWCTSFLLNGGKGSGRAAMIIDVFRDSFFNSHKAGLVHACFEAVVLQKEAR